MWRSLFLAGCLTLTAAFFNFGGGGGGGQAVQFEFGGDISQLFGGGGGGRRRSANANLEVSVKLEDMYNGKDLPLSLQRQAVCSACSGTGAKTQKKCHHCHGRGVIRHPIHPIQQHCPHCEGAGKIAAKKCPKCGGGKVKRETVEKTVKLPPGAPEGHKIVLEKMADEAPGVEPGDVVLHIKSTPHNVFKRNGPTLKTLVPISLAEALLGFTRKVKHLDGREVDVSRANGITSHNHVEVLSGEGMPAEPGRGHRKGNLEVRYTVTYPRFLTSHQKERMIEAFPDQAVAVQEMLEQLEEDREAEEEGDDEEEEE
eukprot:TRINITY_DN429_c0_g1_i1.p2 TRINITY_DN429_c0_g1~~TRINITY_DN429_c0_g1_i1.p2  ORF type:complete len:313 (-),score=85.59 TRINITY_DN429_c0_g1_i1:139-1077(-)